MAEVELSVGVDAAHQPRIREVAEALRKAGMAVTSELEFLGVVTGVFDSERIGELRKVEGVSHVEASQESFALPSSLSP